MITMDRLITIYLISFTFDHPVEFSRRFKKVKEGLRRSTKGLESSRTLYNTYSCYILICFLTYYVRMSYYYQMYSDWLNVLFSCFSYSSKKLQQVISPITQWKVLTNFQKHNENSLCKWRMWQQKCTLNIYGDFVSVISIYRLLVINPD